MPWCWRMVAEMRFDDMPPEMVVWAEGGGEELESEVVEPGFGVFDFLEPVLLAGFNGPFRVDRVEEASDGDPEGGVKVLAEDGEAEVLAVEIGVAIHAGAEIGEGSLDVNPIGGLVVLAGGGRGGQAGRRLLGEGLGGGRVGAEW